MAYPSDMSFKGLVDWAQDQIGSNDINATYLGTKSLSQVQQEVIDSIQPLTDADLREACPDLWV